MLDDARFLRAFLCPALMHHMLDHRFREQARSHRFMNDSNHCGSEPARESVSPSNRYATWLTQITMPT